MFKKFEELNEKKESVKNLDQQILEKLDGYEKIIIKLNKFQKEIDLLEDKREMEENDLLILEKELRKESKWGNNEQMKKDKKINEELLKEMKKQKELFEKRKETVIGMIRTINTATEELMEERRILSKKIGDIKERIREKELFIRQLQSWIDQFE